MGLGCALIKSATSSSSRQGPTTGPQQPSVRPDVTKNFSTEPQKAINIQPKMQHHQQKNSQPNQSGRTINQVQQIKFQIHPQNQAQPQHIQFHPHSNQSDSSKRANSQSNLSSQGTQQSVSHQPHVSTSQYHFPIVPSSLFDEDPGIMSEVETSATGFRRSTKARASLPIVRTPSKTQDRSLGLVFLQYRNETKRALLPNEITSIDTVKALFVRSFPRQLTMDYLDSRNVRIYIHDPSKDMFYELEDLRDVRDRSVLRVYEQDGVNGPWLPVGSVKPMMNSQQMNYHDADPSYFSEPEFDSEYQNQHIHRAKKGLQTSTLPTSASQSQYYGTIIMPPGMRPGMMVSSHFSQHPNIGPPAVRPSPLPAATLPGRTKSYPAPQPVNVPNAAPPKPQRSFHPLGSASSLSSRASASPVSVSSGPRSPATPSGVATTVASSSLQNALPTTNPIGPGSGIGGPFHPIHPYTNRPLPDRPYSVAGHYPTSDNRRSHQDYSGYLSSPERRYANGENVAAASARTSFPPQGYNVSYDDMYGPYGTRSGSATPIIDEEARIRVEFMEKQLASLTGLVQKALSTPQQQPQRMTTSTTDNRGLEKTPAPVKPTPPPKPATLSSLKGSDGSKSLSISNEMYNQLKQLKKRTKDIRSELRNLRRLTQNQTNMARDTLRDANAKLKSGLQYLILTDPLERSLRFNRLRLSKDEEMYKIDVARLEKDLNELESNVEGLRNNVINRRCRVNMSDVESMAIILSRASKNVADLKGRFPHLQEALRTIISHERDMTMREEKFLKEEPERLDQSLRRCKKLTGTLVTLKRLASVQEQRCTPTVNQQPAKLEKSASADSNTEGGISGKGAIGSSGRSTELEPHTIIQVTPAPQAPRTNDLASDSSLEALLNELQTFSKPIPDRPRRSSSSEANKKPVPVPPPRSSSSTINDSQDDQRPIVPSSSIPGRYEQGSTIIRSNSEPNPPHAVQHRSKSLTGEENIRLGFLSELELNPIKLISSESNTSLSSIDSQSSIVEATKSGKTRQQLLEERHQELLKKQKLLQDQYMRLKQLSRGELPNVLLNDLKKTGSESNILSKSSQSMTVSGSLTHIPANKNPVTKSHQTSEQKDLQETESSKASNLNSKTAIKHETQKIYETDIL